MLRDTTGLTWCLALSALALNCSGTTDAGSPHAAGASTGGSVGSGVPAGGAPAAAGGAPTSTSGGGGDTSFGVGGSVVGMGGQSIGGTLGDSTGGTSGSAAGGSSNAAGGSSGAGQAVNCASEQVLCDDFESYAAMSVPNGKWKTWADGAATIVVDTVHAFSGTKAAHIHGIVSHSGPSKAEAFMLAQGAPAFPVSGTTLFVRFMLYGTRFPFTGTTGVNHISMTWIGTSKALNSPDAPAENQGYSLSDYNGISMERLSSGYFRDTTKHFKDPSQANAWHCWEIEIDNAGGPPPGGVGAALPHAWEDGVALNLALAGDKTVPYMAVPFEAVLFSLWSPQADTAASDYWIDDVAVSKTRINCPAQP